MRSFEAVSPTASRSASSACQDSAGARAQTRHSIPERHPEVGSAARPAVLIPAVRSASGIGGAAIGLIQIAAFAVSEQAQGQAHGVNCPTYAKDASRHQIEHAHARSVAVEVVRAKVAQEKAQEQRRHAVFELWLSPFPCIAVLRRAMAADVLLGGVWPGM